TVDTNAGAVLRPLLNDIVENECYLEIRQGLSQTGELAFAIQLDRDRAASWVTNLATVLEALTGIHPQTTANGWSLKKHHPPNLLELKRVDDWVLIGAAQETNTLLADFGYHINSARVPYSAEPAPLWLDADADLRAVASAFSLNW